MFYELLPDDDLRSRFDEMNGKIEATSLIANSLKKGSEDWVKADEALTALKNEAKELENDIKKATRVIEIARLHPKKYVRLLLEHPPREGDPYDSKMGFNTDTFDRALIEASITTVKNGYGEKINDFDWEHVSARIPFGLYQQIIVDTIGLNEDKKQSFTLAD